MRELCFFFSIKLISLASFPFSYFPAHVAGEFLMAFYKLVIVPFRQAALSPFFI